MDSVIGEPFQEHEKRWILGEALKASSIPVEKLLNLVQEIGGPPDWEYMLLPRGRNLSECKAAYELLRPGPRPQPQISPLVHPFQASAQPQHFQYVQQKRKSDPSIHGSPYMTGEPPGKRRQSGLESMGGARNIQPKPPNGADPPSSMVSILAAPTQKRRGRPPKQEVERRNQDAIRRGEIFPALPGMSPAGGDFATSPYAAIAPSPSIGPSPATPQGNPEQNLPDDQPDDSPGKRKRAKATSKPPRALPLKQPGESSFSVNPQLPMVREPQVRSQAFSIATVVETHPVPAPGTIASLMINPPPTTVEAATSAESQPSAEATS